jgi:uncharacterized membrane protein
VSSYLSQRLRRYFLTGLVVLVPLTVTFLIVKWLLTFLDGLLAPLVEGAIGRHIPGLGVFATFLLILFVGFIASNIIGKKLVDFFEAFLLHIPLLSNIYKTLKQFFEMFSSERYRDLKGVVLVQYPSSGAYSLGFVTRELHLSGKGSAPEAMVSVFIPTNNLYMGFTVIVKRSETIPAGLSVPEAIEGVITAGVSLPRELPGRHGEPHE